MKKRLSKRTFISSVVITVVLMLLFLFLWWSGIVVFDHSARVGIEGTFWDGRDYTALTAGCYEAGKRIAKEEPGRNNLGIYEIEGDPEHYFIVAKGGWTHRLYVDDAYQIPTSGRITKVCWYRNCIEDETFLKAINDIASKAKTSFTHETTKELAFFGELGSVFFAYEGCPVATEYKGYMGKMDGKWVITTDIPSVSERRDENGNIKPYTVGFYLIPDKYADVLDQHFKK